jgi:hypothetical protein
MPKTPTKLRVHAVKLTAADVEPVSERAPRRHRARQDARYDEGAKRCKPGTTRPSFGSAVCREAECLRGAGLRARWIRTRECRAWRMSQWWP